MALILTLVGAGLPGSAADAQGYPSDDRRGRYSTNDPAGLYSSDDAAPNDRVTDDYRPANSYCRQLERELASDWVMGRSSQNTLPDLNKQIRRQDRLFNKLQNDADRMDCYESMFIFGRSLRRTKRCLALDRQIRAAKRELARLEDERDSIRDSRTDGNRRNKLIEELARNNCGEQYRYEARRNREPTDWFGSGGLSDFFGGGSPAPKRRREDTTADGIQPYATYRTMCVRLCDGFYFPVSFSTLPSNFPKDIDACQSGCAAPAELYVYRNPGGEVEQMITPNGRPYDSLENAWRFRKEFVKGCSCKAAEYSEADIEATNDAKDSGKSAPARKGKTGQAGKPPAVADKSPARAKTIEDLIR